MFDHPQDHIPGMVLTEAVRQLALCAVGEERGWSPARMYVDRIESTYLCFGELEPSTVLHATVDRNRSPRLLIPARATGAAARRVDTAEVEIDITQNEQTICTARVLVATTAQRGTRAR
jgi:hypothetical protein